MLFVRVLLEFVLLVLPLDFRDLEDRLQLGHLPVEGMDLKSERKRGRMTGRQAQMIATAGSVVDHTAKLRSPWVKMLGLNRLIARAKLIATPLDDSQQVEG